MAAREADTALWLHNKLGSTDDLWSGSSICSQLSREKLLNISECFHNLQPYVKVKLMLSFLHIPKRSLEEWRMELEEILQLAQEDTDQWVAMVGDILKPYPSSGALNTDVEPQHGFFHEVLADLKKIVKKSTEMSLMPMECLYLNRGALLSVAGQQSVPLKHFALQRKPKSASLRKDIQSKSIEASVNLKKNNTVTSIPIKIRSFAKNMDNKTPMKGIPNRSVGPVGFRQGQGLSSSFSGAVGQRPTKREGGVKFLELEEMPVGPKEAKRRKKIAEVEAAEKAKLEKDAAASETPDYAAGLLAPAVSNLSSTSLVGGAASGPSYVPSTSSRIQASTITATVQVNPAGSATQQARENLQQQLQQQLGQTQPRTQPPATPTATTNPVTLTVTTVQQPATATQPPTISVVQQPAQPQPAAPAQQQLQQPQQPQAKKGLSLTREQMMEAQEMFRLSNKVTRPEKALILGFMAGARENPCPSQGDIVNIRLSEHQESIQQPDGMFAPMVVDTYFQMNYSTGEWKRVKKYREIEVDAE